MDYAGIFIFINIIINVFEYLLSLTNTSLIGVYLRKELKGNFVIKKHSIK